jgi:hypothetical protein
VDGSIVLPGFEDFLDATPQFMHSINFGQETAHFVLQIPATLLASGFGL